MPEAHELKRFSWSQLNLLSQCPQKWYLRYVEKIRRPKGIGLIRGKAVDASINHSLTAKLEGEACSIDEVSEIARDKVIENWVDVGLQPEEEERGEIAVKGETVDSAVSLSRLHFSDLRPLLNPVEKPQRWWEVTIKGYDCKIVGVFDTRTESSNGYGPQIHDHKTAKRTPNDDAIHSDQLTMYAMAGRALDGKDPEKVWLDTLVDLKSGPKIKRLEGVRGEPDYRRLLLRIERAIQTIENGVFLPAPDGAWWCSSRWCEYWDDVCPFGARGRTKPKGESK